MELVGRKLAHFSVEAKLGEGGMGVVYRAVDEKLRRTVALKVLPERFSQEVEGRRRLLREARAAAAISHPNIAGVHEIGEEDGRFFVAMEYVNGKTLRALLERGALAVPEALHVARGILRGIAKAHEKGIWHRDLKPDNVMLDDERQVKVLDFGIAKFHDLDDTSVVGRSRRAPRSAPATEAGQIVGTPGYMAPEQAEGGVIDARTDIFAFGVVLYEMLTGVAPFSGATVIDEVLNAGRVTPRLASDLNPAVDPALARVAARCLAKSPDARFASAPDVLAALERLGIPAALPSLPKTVDQMATAETLPMPVTSRRARSRGTLLVALVAFAAAGAFSWILLTRLAKPAASLPAPLVRTTAVASASAVRSTGVPEAAAAYVSALQNLRDARIDRGISDLQRAAMLDPSFAAANLRVLLYSAYRLSPSQRQEQFAAAAQFRSQLDQRDTALLHAAEAWTAQPVVHDEVAARLRAVLDRFPDDPEALYLLGGSVLVESGKTDEAVSALEKAVRADPGSALALWGEGRAERWAYHLPEADRAYGRCLSVSPRASSCLASRGLIEIWQGRCKDLEADARRLVEVEPSGPRAYLLLAQALAANRAPTDAIRAVLDKAVAEKHGPVPRLADLWLAFWTGDLGAAEAAARELDQTAAADTSARQHAAFAWALVDVYEELGDEAKALATAESFERRRTAWADDAGTSMPWYAFYARRHAGRVPAAEFVQQREDLFKRTLTGDFPTFLEINRFLAYAVNADAPDELRDAAALLPSSPVASLDPLLEVYPGRVLLLLGRVDDALPHLSTAATQCALLPDLATTANQVMYRSTVLAVRAHLLLGQALEAKGDKSGACEAYGFVTGVWKDAKPRSVTLERARARARALRCP